MSLVLPNAIVATGLRQPEGPVHVQGRGMFLVEMDETRACLTEILPDGNRREICRPGGRPTGLAIDGEGCFWVAGGPLNSLVRLSPEGKELLRIEGDADGPFLFPNDLAFGPDDRLYMTDSGMRPTEFIRGLAIRPDFRDAPYDGRIFQIDPVRGVVERRLASGLRFANGIAFDEKGALYTNESLTGWIHRLTPLDERLRNEPFSEVHVTADPTGFAGPDGMAFDAAGRLHCAIYGGGCVTASDATGAVVERLKTNGSLPTNVAFIEGTNELLITEVEHGVIEKVTTAVAGLVIHRPVVVS